MIVRADLHVHSIGSADGSSSVSDLAAAAKAGGLDAVAVCDHDFFTVPPKNESVLLIPGIEITSENGHILGLFLEKPVSLPEGGTPSTLSAIDAIHAAGGLAVLAHPFAPQKLPEEALKKLPVDAIETVNARAAVKPGANERAAGLAEALQLPVTGGSDGHCAKEVGGAYTQFDVCECTISSLKAALSAGKTNAVLSAPCLWRYKARSLLKKRRKDHGLIGTLYTLPYAVGCLARDLLHL